jgi:ELWxxDGT repeat protein
MKFNGSTVTLIKDEFAGAGSSSPWHMNVFNGKIYYSAVDSINSREIYSSDGTSAGSGLLAEIFPGSVVCAPMDYFCYGGPNSSDPRLFTEYDGKLIFSAVNGTVGGELFVITPPVVIPQVVAPSAPVVQQVTRHIYQGPLFSPIEARRFDATVGGKVVVTGKRLESVTQILLDGKVAEITSATFNQIEFIAPASAPGTPELTIKFGSGTLIWINALTYYDVVVEKAKLQNRIPKATKLLKKPKPKK